jgi:hypothetical protein
MQAPNKNIPETIEIRNGPFKGRYSIHPVAALFPLVQNKDYDRLKQSITVHGQQEPIVIHGNVLLDGRNRLFALNELNAEPKVIEFDQLRTGLTPDEWIIVKNLERRSLTDDQRLAIAAKYGAFRKEQNAQLHPGNPEIPPGWTVIKEEGEKRKQNFPQKSAEIIDKPKRGRPRGRRTEVIQLSAQTKQSRYRAEQILKLRDQSPDLAAKVEQGSMTLKEAIAQVPQLGKETGFHRAFPH